MISPSPPRAKATHFDGDSLFARGNGNVANVFEAPYACYDALATALSPSPAPLIFTRAISGRTITVLISEFATKVKPSLRPNDIVIMNELTNELQAVQDINAVYSTLQSYCALVRAENCKVVIATLTARGAAGSYANTETDRLALNTMIRNGWSSFADGMADVGGLSQFNSVAATSNTTYYDTDFLHFKSPGYLLYGQTFAPVIQGLL